LNDAKKNDSGFGAALAKVCGIGLLIVVVDQLSKEWVASHLREAGSLSGAYDRIVIIPGFFDIIHHRNFGAAFGIMQGRHLLFIVATLVAMYLLFWMFRSTWKAGERRLRWLIVWGLFLGGALGNLVDRVRGQGVVDFLHVYYAPLGDYPTFNVADSCITIGIILLILFSLPTRPKKKDKDYASLSL